MNTHTSPGGCGPYAEPVETMDSATTAYAVGLCARSNDHTSGTGTHDALRHGACSLHRQMATETFALVPTDLLVNVEWASGQGPQFVFHGDDHERAVRDAENRLVPLLRRVAVRSRREGLLLGSDWLVEPS